LAYHAKGVGGSFSFIACYVPSWFGGTTTKSYKRGEMQIHDFFLKITLFDSSHHSFFLSSFMTGNRFWERGL